MYYLEDETFKVQNKKFHCFIHTKQKQSVEMRGNGFQIFDKIFSF